MSQQDLGGKIGLTFQQVQKYETASNRISASTLFEIASALDVPVTYFFGGLTRNGPAAMPSQGDPDGSVAEFVTSEDGIDLASNYPRIRNPKQKQLVLDLVRSFAETNETSSDL